MPKSTVPDAEGNDFTEEEKQVTMESGSPDRPLSQMPVSSPSTEESISAFIERTVSSLELPSQEFELMDLPAPSPATVTTTSHAGLLNVSVSEPIVVNQDWSTEKPAADDNAETTSQLRTGPLYADTSDVEDLLDSSGVDVFPPSPLPWPGIQLLSLNLKGSSETRPAIVTLNKSSTELELPVLTDN